VIIFQTQIQVGAGLNEFTFYHFALCTLFWIQITYLRSNLEKIVLYTQNLKTSVK
jgi:hypothetical protein